MGEGDSPFPQKKGGKIGEGEDGPYLSLLIVPKSMQKKIHTESLTDRLSFDLILVEEGDFRMGSDAGPEVHLSAFYLGVYPVTQDVWEEVMKSNPSYFRGPRRPVEQVSWYDAAVFCNALSERCGYDPAYYGDEAFQKVYGKTDQGYELPNKGEVFRKVEALGYRLPTEAEWEYAARGGKDPDQRPAYEFAGGDKLDEVGWYRENSHRETKPVDLKLPNELDLYDMSGNVWEWCEDWYGRLRTGKLDNPRGPNEGSRRVYRGGGWSSTAEFCRSADRFSWHPAFRYFNQGFRLVLSIPPV